MTLCIARRIKGIPHLASDSRITFGAGDRIDFGIKVFSVPVKIYAPTIAESGITELYKEFSIGMCVAGSATNAYIVKEAIYELLQHLQFIPGHTNVSMEGICQVIKKVFERVAKDMGMIFRERGYAVIIITGKCPHSETYRTYMFTMDLVNGLYEATFNEILISNDTECIGSGSTIANELINQNPTWNTLKIIKEAIKTGRDPGIGGGLQFGTFDNRGNFVVKGVQDYHLDGDGYPQYEHQLRGIDIYKEEFEAASNDFHIAYSFITPFQQEIDEIWRQHPNSQ